jgi:hypothetical protein
VNVKDVLEAMLEARQVELAVLARPLERVPSRRSSMSCSAICGRTASTSRWSSMSTGQRSGS